MPSALLLRQGGRGERPRDNNTIIPTTTAGRERKTNPNNLDNLDSKKSKPSLFDPGFLKYCQAYVNKIVRIESPQDSSMADPEESEPGCCVRCGRCLSAIPGPSLCCWILLTVGVCATSASLYVGVKRTRDLLDQSDTFLQYTEIVTMAVLAGMVVLGILFLVMATIMSHPANKWIFTTRKKNSCGSGFNIAVIMMMLFFYLIWLGCTLLLAVPVMYFTLLHILYKHLAVENINLRNYALHEDDYIIQGPKLDSFYTESKDVFICYIVALAGSVIVLISMTLYLMCAAANHVYMKEARYSAYNAYRNDQTASKTSVHDTRM